MSGRTGLDRAAQSAGPRNGYAGRFPAVAQLLLDHGAEISVAAAVALGDVDQVRAMLARNPAALRENLRNGGLLSLAVNHNQIEMVEVLLDLGADVDERVLLEELEEPTLSWGGPLWSAAMGNQLEIARVLLDRGADPNANVYAAGWPLSNAWNHEGGAVKRLLLERGARPQPHTVADETHSISSMLDRHVPGGRSPLRRLGAILHRHYRRCSGMIHRCTSG